MPYRHLLVPVDFTEPAAAVEAALELAAQHRSRTTLLHVIEAIDRATEEPDEETRRFYAELETSVRERLDDLARLFESAGLSVEQEIVVGHRVRDIVHYSAVQSVDLIVMRSRRVDPTQPARGIGTVSHQVSVLSQCPVMLIK